MELQCRGSAPLSWPRPHRVNKNLAVGELRASCALVLKNTESGHQAKGDLTQKERPSTRQMLKLITAAQSKWSIYASRRKFSSHRADRGSVQLVLSVRPTSGGFTAAARRVA
jgi:hypothetical protein